ncbi:patched domain-containing protein 3-like [Schistocerca nitens]|uniref:patched domain-containing protein 3-like n=1 Tax=Schistocerca nitens TaxID=7011 RepID=UPI00211959EB|nr:patched domain-containing protein 3-like [Schistocerca nitens]
MSRAFQQRSDSVRLLDRFEGFFYRLAVIISKRPVHFFVGTLLFTVLTATGLFFWNEEVHNVKLFLNPSMDLYKRSRWVDEHFKDQLRYEIIIVESDNVLRPDVLQWIADLQTSIKEKNVSGIVLYDVCARYNTWFEGTEGIDLSAFSDFIDIDSIPIPNECLYQSILKLWTVNGIVKENLVNETQEMINKKVSTALMASSDVSILDDITSLLAGVEWNLNKTEVLGARATIIIWMLDKSHSSSAEWELGFIEEALFSNRTLPPRTNIYAISTRSYDDFIREVVENNTTLLFAGFSLIILYVILMMSKYHPIEQRVYLSLLGVSIIGQSILASYGLCFYMGFFWGPLHPVLPFLLLGIGVDNIFVIMQSLDNVNEGRKDMNVPEKIGLTLKKCGISVTVTILTDVIAFAVGTSTKMPFLRSFCVFAAVGIACVYVYVMIFFVSCLSIDERRVMARREGCFFRKHDENKNVNCRRDSIQQRIFANYFAPYLVKWPVKVAVLLTTVVLLGINIVGVLRVERKFDPMWYLNQGSYPIKFNEKLVEYFPFYGKRGGIYMRGIDYYYNYYQANNNALEFLISKLAENPYISQGSQKIWFKDFQNYLESQEYDAEDSVEYNNYLTEFLLLTNNGQSFIKDLKFDGFPLEGYNITASQIPFQYIMLNSTAEQIKAMQSIEELVASLNITEEEETIFTYSADYVSWTANKIVGEELFRNLAITCAAVFAVTLCLIKGPRAVVLVNLCVILTVTDLIGSMYWSGLTIEISSSLMILLCAGLTVDYAAHVGHEYVHAKGTRNERAVECIRRIGPAVFNGGFSTFLAFSLLGISDSYLFTTFFKLFAGVVAYGLFHGLIFLPVILSICGPQDKKSTKLQADATNGINRFAKLLTADKSAVDSTFVDLIQK